MQYGNVLNQVHPGMSSTGLRNLVIGADTQVPLGNGTCVTVVNFDNAATTPPFFSVMNEINRFSPWYSSIHRGRGYKSMLSTQVYEEGRQVVADFVNADMENDVIIYTKNTTESVNMLSYVLSQQKGKRDIVLSTWMEHAANDLPWREKFTVGYVDIDKEGKLSMDDLESKLRRYGRRVKVVAVTGASNVTGYINPVYDIARLAHRYGAQIFVDGAQAVPHMHFDMKPYESVEHIDYLAFSAHKMYAPFGAGVLIGPAKAFSNALPYSEGGSAIVLVTHNRIEWHRPPMKDEAGTPNLMGVIAMTTAIRTLSSLGMKNIFKHEESLLNYAVREMKKITGIRFYSNAQDNETISIIPFNIEGVDHQLMSAILSYEAGIAVRNGFFCSHPYCERLLGLTEEDMDYYFNNPDAIMPGIVRVSLGIYNNYQEINRLIYALKVISLNKQYYVDKYTKNRLAYRIPNEV